MKRLEVDYAWRGSQVRAYGPRRYDLTITLDPGENSPEFHYTLFESYARKLGVNWSEPGDGDWFSWRLKHAERLHKNAWRFIIEQPYDD